MLLKYSITIKVILVYNEIKLICELRKSESVPLSLKQEHFGISHPMRAKLCQNILELKYDVIFLL